MPIYEYQCPGCGHPFKKRVSFSESEDRQTCPECGNAHGRRQLSLIGGISGVSSSGGASFSSANCGPVG